MKRQIPGDIYRELPCSVVAVGCAMGIQSPDALQTLKSADLHSDGYLSLRAMETLIKANMEIRSKVYYKKDDRPLLRDFAHAHKGEKAIICLLGHYIYFDGHDYHSFFWNGGDPVVQVWFLKED